MLSEMGLFAIYVKELAVNVVKVAPKLNEKKLKLLKDIYDQVWSMKTKWDEATTYKVGVSLTKDVFIHMRKWSITYTEMKIRAFDEKVWRDGKKISLPTESERRN